MSDLQVASFNIRTGWGLDGANSWPFRRGSVAATIRALDADVLGLQEVVGFQLGWLGRQLPDYRAVGVGRSRTQQGEHCPILVRREVARVTWQRTRWYGDHPDTPGTRLPGARFPRIATTCHLELIATGAVVQFTSTHLDARRHENRRRSAEQLVGWLDSSLPEVVVGDLNADPEDDVLRLLAGGGLRQALPPEAGGTNHDFTGRTDGPRIDHVLVSDHFEVLTSRVCSETVGSRLPSDHWPVAAQLRLTPITR